MMTFLSNSGSMTSLNFVSPQEPSNYKSDKITVMNPYIDCRKKLVRLENKNNITNHRLTRMFLFLI